MVSRNKKHKDPHAGREAQNYDNPIQSREFILAHLKERGRRQHTKHCVPSLIKQALKVLKRLGAV